MSDTVKLIVEIPKAPKNDHERWVLVHGTPLDDVKAEIETERHNLADTKEWGRYYGLGIALEILDNIGKAESEDT